MNSKEVRKLNDEEIGVEMERLRRRHFELRNQSVTEKIEDFSQFAKIKNDRKEGPRDRGSFRLNAAIE